MNLLDKFYEIMFGNTKEIVSNQITIHENLESVVKKHLDTSHQRPVENICEEIFDAIDKGVNQYKGKIILDSGCGTGLSTINLARLKPDYLHIGIDKSAFRLGKEKKEIPENCIFVRSDLSDFWHILKLDNIKVYKNYILYPNPWPKKKHLLRRFHASPAFSYLLALGGKIELRTNWKIYLDEFAHALRIAGIEDIRTEELFIKTPLSLFEKKLHESGHRLYKLNAIIDK